MKFKKAIMIVFLSTGLAMAGFSAYQYNAGSCPLGCCVVDDGCCDDTACCESE